MTFEKALNQVGDYGRYQNLLLVFVFFTSFLCSINYYNQIIIFTSPTHLCKPLKNDSVNYKTDSCFEYQRRNSSTRLESGSFVQIRGLNNQSTLFHRKECMNGWEYDHTRIFPTIASELNWVCDQDSNQAYLNQAFWIGNVLGCGIWGPLNDSFGRKPTILLVFLVYFCGNACTFFAPGFWSLIFVRFIVGTAHLTTSHLPYLLALEYCGVEKRTRPLFLMIFSYTLASIATPIVAQVMGSWTTLLSLATFPSALVLLGYRLIPESPSWFLCQGKVEEAKTALKTVAKVNGIKDLDVNTLNALLNEEEEEIQIHYKQDEVSEVKPNLFTLLHQLFHHTRLLLHVLLSILLCIVAYMCFYGQIENTPNLGQDFYWSLVLGSLMEVPALSVPFLVNILGRKSVLCFLLIASSVSSIGFAFIPTAMSSLLFVVAMSGRMFATGAYYISLQFASEIYPTCIRGSGMALCEIMGGIGLFISPQIVYLGKTNPSVPLFIFGTLSMVGTVCAFLLPETCHEELPQTLVDGDNFGKNQKRLGFCPTKRNGVERDENDDILESTKL